MHSHILIPVALDHDAVVPRKIEVARKMLNPGGKITLLTVLENVPGFVQEFVTVKSENHLTARIKVSLDEAAQGADDIATEVLTGKPGVRVAEYANEQNVDLIIVGSHHPGARDYFLGSTAARVARRAPCSVLILR